MASLPDSAEVDFTGGLAPGKWAYFSLEGALATAKLTAREGRLPTRYVALGDSFSSGEGNPPFPGTDSSPILGLGSTNKCHRSSQAYGALIKSDLNISNSNFMFRACSGAIMADFVASLHGATGQWTDGAQLDAIAPKNQPSDSTGLVTLSIGGNDAGFPFVLEKCVGLLGLEGDAGCLAKIKTSLALATRLLGNGGTILVDTLNNSYRFCGQVCVAIYSVLDKIPGYRYQIVAVPSLAGLYEKIHQRAPQAAIRVLLYPHLFPAKPSAQCVAGFPFGLDQTEMKAINNAGDSLDRIISSAVTAAQGKGIDIQPVDARQDFAGHEECSAAPWFNGLILQPLPSPYSFHPNAQGQKEFAALFEAKL
jgi:lysophospholipase L1-like esterase